MKSQFKIKEKRKFQTEIRKQEYSSSCSEGDSVSFDCIDIDEEGDDQMMIDHSEIRGSKNYYSGLIEIDNNYPRDCLPMANEIINFNEESAEKDIHKGLFELFNSKEPVF